MPLDEVLARMADLQLDARLPSPAGVLALEEMAEETLLQVEAVVGVEMRPMGVAMHLEPFLLRGGGRGILRNSRAGASPWPPQLAALKSGSVILPKSGVRSREAASSNG